MATDNRTLMLSIHASTEVAREQLQRLVGVIGDTSVQVDAKLSDIEAKFANVGQGISTSSAVIAGAVGGFVSGLVQQLPAALIRAGIQAMDYAASIGETSQQLGIGASFLQEYRFAATQTGASTEQADDAMTRFSATVGKAADGNKRAAASFNNIGVEIADSNGKLKPTEQLFRETVDAISMIPDPARQSADAVNLFGENGAKILPVLTGGSQAFNDYAAAARSLGLVIDDAMIAKLDGLSDKMAAIKQVVTTQMAVAIADNADSIIALGNAAGGAIGQLGELLTRARGIKALYHDHGILGLIGASEQDETRYGSPEGRKADLEAGVRGAQQNLRAAQAQGRSGNSIASVGPNIAALQADLANRRKILADFVNSDEYQAGVRAGVVPAAGHAGGDVTAPASKAPKAGKGAKAATAGQSLEEMIDALPKVKLSFAGMGDEIDRAFGKLDGTGATIDEIVNKAFSLGDALKMLKLPDFIDKEQEQRVNDFGKSLSTNIGQALIYGQKLGPALVNSLKAAAAEAISSNLFKLLTGGGDGGGSGFLGAIIGGAAKLFGGAYADGGDPPVGQWSLVGERGPELIKPRAAMTVIPNGQFGRGGGRNAPAQNVNVSVDVNPSPLFVVAARAVASEAGASAAVGALRGISDTGIGRQ